MFVASSSLFLNSTSRVAGSHIVVAITNRRTIHFGAQTQFRENRVWKKCTFPTKNFLVSRCYRWLNFSKVKNINTLVSGLLIILSQYHKIINRRSIFSDKIVWPFVKSTAFAYRHTLRVLRMDEQFSRWIVRRFVKQAPIQCAHTSVYCLSLAPNCLAVRKTSAYPVRVYLCVLFVACARFTNR